MQNPLHMLRPATPADLPRLRELASRANDAPYDLAAVIEEKCFADDGVAQVWDDGDALRGVAVSRGRFLRLLAVDRAFRRRGIGSALLHAAGRPAIIFAEPVNYFTPGVLTTDEATLAFLRRHRYRATRTTTNMHAAARRHDVQASRADERTFAFIRDMFGSLWHAEARKARVVFSVEMEGRIAGFAAIEANNRGLGTFGPTGVDPALRGRGLGRQLLLAAIDELARLGFTRVIIPWTDAIDFYRKSCGAEPAHQFVTMELE